MRWAHAQQTRVSKAWPAPRGQYRHRPALPPTRVLDLPPHSPARRLQLSLANFELLRRIGDGSYSHVVLARHRESGLEYALKVVDKQYILR